MKPAEAFRAALIAAWIVGLVAIAAGGFLLVLMIPAGLLLVVLGFVLQADRRDLMAGLRALGPPWWGPRAADPTFLAGWMAAALVFVGLCWIGVGVAAGLT